MFLTNICFAEPKHQIDENLKQCLAKKENMTTAGMVACTNVAIQEWDKELNISYKALMDKLDAKAKEKLKNSQRAWIKYRDLEYENIESIYEGLDGSMYIQMQAMDKLKIIKARVLELNSYLSTLSI